MTFEVKELPIIRDIQFEGLKSLSESDILKEFREKRVGVSKESIEDQVKLKNATRLLKEMLAAKGHPNATVTVVVEHVSATSDALAFRITEGPRVRILSSDGARGENDPRGRLRRHRRTHRGEDLRRRIRPGLVRPPLRDLVRDDEHRREASLLRGSSTVHQRPRPVLFTRQEAAKFGHGGFSFRQPQWASATAPICVVVPSWNPFNPCALALPNR